MRPRVALLLLLTALAPAACNDGTACCEEGGALAVVRGHLLDVTYAPLADAAIQADGTRRRCEATDQEVGPAEGMARSDSAGAFVLSIFSFLGGPGRSCVRLVITPTAAPPDTSAAIEVEFYTGGALDTTEVLLRVPTG